MRYLILCGVFILVTTASALGQSTPFSPRPQKIPYYALDPYSTPFYELSVRRAMASYSHGGQSHNFESLRRLYSNTAHYDPEGRQALSRLDDLAGKVLNSPEEARPLYVRQYQLFIRDHFANLAVLKRAREWARLNPVFGSWRMFAAAERDLIRSLYQNADGSSASLSFDIITLAEEIAIVESYNLEHIGTLPVRSGSYVINRHVLRHPDTGRVRVVYTNISRPVQKMEADRELN